MNHAYSAPGVVTRVQRPALIVGIISLAILLLGALLNPTQFFQSYLFAFLFWAGIPLGCLSLLMLQHLTGGGWGLIIRRLLEAATRTLPLILLLFIPVALGAAQIYPWMSHEVMSASPALEDKARYYLNYPFFLVRAAVYFAVWLVLTYFLNKWSLEQDRTGERRFGRRMRALSAPGLILFVLSVTFASVDWAMSLNPLWFSTIYGLLFVAAWSLSALAFAIMAMAFLSEQEPMSRIATPTLFQDLGKLMLALVMLWAYFAFSQFLIVWSANLPEEIEWYLPRTSGGWGIIAVLLVVFHFGFPFLLLLSASLKRNPKRLQIVAGLILAMRVLDMFWMVAPEFHHHHFTIAFTDVVAVVGLGGLWLAAFAWQFNKRPLIPFNDPQFEDLMSQAQTGH